MHYCTFFVYNRSKGSTRQAYLRYSVGVGVRRRRNRRRWSLQDQAAQHMRRRPSRWACRPTITGGWVGVKACKMQKVWLSHDFPCGKDDLRVDSWERDFVHNNIHRATPRAIPLPYPSARRRWLCSVAARRFESAALVSALLDGVRGRNKRCALVVLYMARWAIFGSMVHTNIW